MCSEYTDKAIGCKGVPVGAPLFVEANSAFSTRGLHVCADLLIFAR